MPRNGFRRARIDADGIFRLYSLDSNQSGNWFIQWSSSAHKCDPKSLCDVNSYCTLMDRDPICKCLTASMQKAEAPIKIGRAGTGDNASLAVMFCVLAFSGVLMYRHWIQQYKRIMDQRDSRLVEDVTSKSFTYEELKSTTNNFMDCISKGGYGTVFRGVISNRKQIVAI
ncbi:hypothetical protein V6N13_047830 [Hibiscus sabdariffa]